MPSALPPAGPQPVHPAHSPQPGRPSPSSQPANSENEETVPFIQFPNADIQTVLDFYEKLTGKKIIRDSTAQGNINVVVNRAMTKSEAIQILETALEVNSITLMKGRDDIVIVLGTGKSARSYGVPIYFDLDELPQDDTVVTFIFKLEYADPTEAMAVLAQYVQSGGGAAPGAPPLVLGAPGKAQSIAVTENATVIRSLAEIVKQLDKPPAEVVSEFITLERADAKDVLDKLEKIFEKKENQAGGSAAAGQPGQPPQPNQAQAGEGAGNAMPLSEDSLIVGKIKLTADIRTNRIHVVTRPVNMPFVRRLIKEFDTDVEFGEPTVRPLRFVSAGDVLDVIVKAITQPGAKEEGGGETKAAAPVSNPSSYTGNSATSGSGTLGAEELTTKEVETAPEARTVGNTKIIADRRANTIIVMGNDEVKEKIFKVLDEIDVRSPQVMLTVVIGELTLTNDKTFGAQYILHPQSAAGSLAAVLNNVTLSSGSTLPNLSTLTNAATTAAALGGGGGLTGLIKAGSNLDIVVNALESTGRFHVISRPEVFTSNNKKAIIASGQQVPVPSQTQSSYGGVISSTNGLNNGLVSTSNVTYQDVSLKLEVQPLINSDNEVTLDIVQEVNSLANSAGVTTTSGITAPTINSRRIKTTVSVANEATVVLGGLVQETKNASNSGVPVLCKIPVLGQLFNTKSTTIERDELIVMIRPTVTNTPVSAVKAGERVQEGLDFPPDLEHTVDPAGTRLRADKPSTNLLVAPKIDTVK